MSTHLSNSSPLCVSCRGLCPVSGAPKSYFCLTVRLEAKCSISCQASPALCSAPVSPASMGPLETAVFRRNGPAGSSACSKCTGRRALMCSQGLETVTTRDGDTHAVTTEGSSGLCPSPISPPPPGSHRSALCYPRWVCVSRGSSERKAFHTEEAVRWPWPGGMQFNPRPGEGVPATGSPRPAHAPT